MEAVQSTPKKTEIIKKYCYLGSRYRSIHYIHLKTELILHVISY